MLLHGMSCHVLYFVPLLTHSLSFFSFCIVCWRRVKSCLLEAWQQQQARIPTSRWFLHVDRVKFMSPWGKLPWSTRMLETRVCRDCVCTHDFSCAPLSIQSFTYRHGKWKYPTNSTAWRGTFHGRWIRNACYSWPSCRIYFGQWHKRECRTV